MEYKKDYRIYVVQFGTTFQYLITDTEKNLYQDNIRFKPSFTNRIKYALRLIPVPYTKDEMQIGEDMILSGAVQSIDAIILNKRGGRADVAEINKTAALHRDKNRCMWRAVSALDGSAAWECLTHAGNIVQMNDGTKPFHDVEAGTLPPFQFKEKENG